MSKPVNAKRGTVVAPNALLYIRAATLQKYLRPTQIVKDQPVEVLKPAAKEGDPPIKTTEFQRSESLGTVAAARWMVVFALIGHPDERDQMGAALASGALQVDHVEGVDPLKAAYARINELVLTDGWTFEAV